MKSQSTPYNTMNVINNWYLSMKFLRPLDSTAVRICLILILVTIMIFASILFPSSKETGTAKVYSEIVTHKDQTDASDSGIAGGSIQGDCKAGNRCLPIYCVQTEENGQKLAALSFDAAWGADDTIRILDILDAHQVKATFFMTGGWVDTYPDMVKEIYARGHDLGNHSMNHKQMSKLSTAQQTQEIKDVGDKVLTLTGYQMFLFRPPYGDYNTRLIETSYHNNYYPIQWSVDSLDWKNYGTASIIKNVVNNPALDSGSIILMHNGAKYTADALDSVIAGLKERGYTLVPISQLILRENFHMDGTGKQIAD